MLRLYIGMRGDEVDNVYFSVCVCYTSITLITYM